MRWFVALLAITTFGLSGPTAAHAEVMIGGSLEWLTGKSDLVVVGRIEKIASTAPAREYLNPTLHEITFAVTTTNASQSQAPASRGVLTGDLGKPAVGEKLDTRDTV